MAGIALSKLLPPRRQIELESCPRNCSGRGTCRQGFCHCPTGWFGRDCSRSRAYHPPILGAQACSLLAFHACSICRSSMHGQLRPCQAAGMLAAGVDHPVHYGDIKIYMYELPWQARTPADTNLLHPTCCRLSRGLTTPSVWHAAAEMHTISCCCSPAGGV